MVWALFLLLLVTATQANSKAEHDTEKESLFMLMAANKKAGGRRINSFVRNV